MKKFLAVLLTLAMLLSIASFAVAEGKMRVAMITDYGDITDLSFNEPIYAACKAFCGVRGLDFQYYKPDSNSDPGRVSAIEKAISDGFNVIVMSGYAFGPAIQEVVPEFIDITFIALDVSGDDIGDLAADVPANLYCAVYQEELCGYMAGYAAVKLGYKKLGFLGGKEVPSVIRYGYGFVQGADAAATELGLTDVEIKYVYGNLFSGDSDFTTYLDTWYANGTEIVFACGGSIFTSAGEAAQKAGGKIIGVDTDQASVIDGMYGEGITVTSAMKDLPATVNSELSSILNAEFEGGKIENLGLVSENPGENFVQIAPSTQFSDSFTADDYATLVAKMFAGEITVSSVIDVEPAVIAVAVDYQGSIK